MKPTIAIVTKQTSFSKLVQEQENNEIAKKLLEDNNPVSLTWKNTHEQHSQTLEHILNIIQKDANFLLCDIPSALSIEDNKNISLVISIGGDGTFLAASHGISSNIPILGVNSSPNSSIGYFCRAIKDNFNSFWENYLNNNIKTKKLARMKIIRNNKQIISNRILNDALFCNICPGSTSTYIIKYKQKLMTQKSSGFWIGPPAGSTAARSSAGFNPLPLWDGCIELCVRELYNKPGEKPGLKSILAFDGEEIEIISKMENAAIYMDGNFKAVPISLGDTLAFSVSSDEYLTYIV